MRILGLDYGDKRIGVAVSDQLKLIASALEIIYRKSTSKFTIEDKRLNQIINEYDVDKIVVGYPKNLNNSHGWQSEKTLSFKLHLEELFPGLEIILWDERLSSICARRILFEAGIDSRSQKKIVDKVAAVFILQGYLDYLNSKEDNKMDYEEFENDRDNIIVMFDDDGNEQELFVLGSVEDNGQKYLIVSENLDSDAEEQDVVILKEISSDDEENADYHIVEDDDELEHIINLFEQQYDEEDE